MNSKEVTLTYLDAIEEELGAIAKAIWSNPEVALQELSAARRFSGKLEQEGFTIDEGIGQMPTAFIGTWGAGKPIIGLLGEYDALPDLSQRVSPTKEPVEAGGAGHGCGHNLLGVASLGAALAVKEALEKNNLSGTIKFYGCPAEETLVGKVFMARDGAFDGLDAAIAWHPLHTNTVWGGSTLALNSFKVNFHGVAAHAAAMPHMGKSALDGAQLMDIGVNYLREHIVQEARIHCVITHGGDAPNIVPPYAQIWYFVRAPHRAQVEEIYSRMLDIAQGAALMSGTTHDIDFQTGCYELLPNGVISDLMIEKMKELGGPRFTDEEMTFAKQLQDTIPPQELEKGIMLALQMSGTEVTRKDLGETLGTEIVPPSDTFVLPASTDVGDVSQITPTANLCTCCWPLGTPGHSWQAVAASGSGVGFRAMVYAAKALALTALALMTKPELLKAAQLEFEKQTAGKQYRSPLPEGAQPH